MYDNLINVRRSCNTVIQVNNLNEIEITFQMRSTIYPYSNNTLIQKFIQHDVVQLYFKFKIISPRFLFIYNYCMSTRQLGE